MSNAKYSVGVCSVVQRDSCTDRESHMLSWSSECRRSYAVLCLGVDATALHSVVLCCTTHALRA